MTNKFKLGIVGLSRGKGFVKVFGAHPRVEVSALCDIDEEKLVETGKAFNLADNQLYTNFDEFINAPIDIVVVATPIPFHAEQSAKSLMSGKHVLCEQTVAYTIEECETVLEAVRKSGKTYMMAENYCYFHYIREWKEIINQGRLGEIFYAEAEYIHNIVNLLENKETGEFYWRAERPPIWYCAHCLGPILTLTGDRVVKACGLTSGFHIFPERKDKLGFMDMEVGLFQTEKGKVIKILRSQTAIRKPQIVWYCLYGTKGCIENGRVNSEEGMLYIPDEMGEDSKAKPLKCSKIDPALANDPTAVSGGHGTSEYYMIRDFLDAVEHNTTPPIDIIRALDFTVPGIIAHQSAMVGGKWIDVPVYT